MAWGEPWYKKREREQRMRQTYPELEYASPSEITQVDKYRLSSGGPLTQFSQAAMRLAAHAAEEAKRKREEEERRKQENRTRPADPYGPEALALPGVQDGAYDESRFRPRAQAQSGISAFDARYGEDEGRMGIAPTDTRIDALGTIGERINRPIAEDLTRAPVIGGAVQSALDVPALGPVLREATRPTNWMAAAVPQFSFARGAGYGVRLGAEAIGAAAGIGAGEKTYELTEGLPEPARIGLSGLAGIGAGLGAGYGSARALQGAGRGTRGGLRAIDEFLGDAPVGYVSPAGVGELNVRIFPGSTTAKPETIRAITNAPRPPKALEDVFGVHEPVLGISKADEVRDAVRRMFRRPEQTDPIGTPLFRQRQQVVQNVESIANERALAARQIVEEVFDFDKQWRIQSLAGRVKGFDAGPTLQDLAARRKDFDPFLMPHQRQALDELEQMGQPFNRVLTDVGIDVGKRGDVKPGGFYMHRAYEGVIGEPNIERVRLGARTVSGKRAFEKPDEFNSMAAAISQGFQPLPPWDAVRRYVTDVGERSTNQYVGDWLKAVEEGGTRVAKTQADRTPKGIAARVASLRASAAGLRQTLIRQQTRVSERTAELSQTQRTTAQRGLEAATSRARAQVLPGVTPDDIRVARTTVTEQIQEARVLSREIGEQTGAIRAAKKTLSTEERSLANEAKQLDDMLRRADELASRAGRSKPAEQQYREALRMADRIEAKMGRMSERAAALAERMDTEIERGAVLQDLDRETRQALVESRRAERAASTVERNLKVAEREIMLLEREAQRAARAEGSALVRMEAAGTRVAGTESMLQHTRNELLAIRDDWEKAKAIARLTPRESGEIGLAELTGTAFPLRLANAANRILQEEMPTTGAKAHIVETVDALNNLYRGFRATLDNSAPGIQGLLGLASDQRAYAEALKVNIKAWGIHGDRSLGSFIVNFNRSATKGGRATADIWARDGLRIGGSNTEYTLGRGFAQGLGQAPGIRQANRAFGYFGDALRLAWADDILEHEMKVRKISLQEAVNQGMTREISEALNRATGWSRKRFVGDIGDILLFAPRFLQSRLEVVINAARGLAPGAPLEARLARKQLTRLVGYGTLLTVAINEALGNETDFRPLVNGRFNSNWISIRAAGQDWSLFGTWGSLTRAIVLTAMGQPHDALRGMSSGIVSNAWDFITGADALGRAVPNTRAEIAADPERFATRLLENIIPFPAVDIPDIIEDVRRGVEGEIAAFGEAAAVAFGEVFGAKSAPLTVTDRLTDLANELFGDRKDFYERPQSEQQEVLDAHQDLAEQRSTERIERGNEYERVKQAIQEEQLASDARLESKELGWEQWIDDYRDRQQQLFGAREALRVGEGIKPGDTIVDQYYQQIEMAERADGTVDWDQLDAWTGGLDEEELAEIDRETGISGTATVREYRAATKDMRKSGYYDLRDKAWESFKQHYPEQLGDLGDYWGWRDQTTIEVAKQIEAEGVQPAIAMQEAARVVAGYKTVTAFNEFYRTDFRHGWVVDNEELARQAWGMSLFDPDKAEREFMLGQRKAQ